MQLTVIALYQKCLLCSYPSGANSGVLSTKRKPMESSIKPCYLLLRWTLTLTALIPETGKALKLKHFSCLHFCSWWVFTVHLPQWCTLLSTCICMPVHRPDLLLCKLTNYWPPVAESFMVLLYTVLAGKDIADKWCLFLSKWIWAVFVLWVFTSWMGFPWWKHKGRKICRKTRCSAPICCLLFCI